MNFEQFLMEIHAENHIGTKDCMLDDFNEWIITEDMDIIIKHGDEFAKKQSKELLEALKMARSLLVVASPKHKEDLKSFIEGEKIIEQAIANAENITPNKI